MKKLFNIIILLCLAVNAISQSYIDHLGIIRMKYGTPNDILTISFDSDSCKYYSLTNPFHKFNGGLIIDSLKLNGTWGKTFGSTYSAGFGLGLSGSTFYNTRYWKNQDTVKTTLTGLLKATSGVLSVASAGTDYQAPLTNPVTGSLTSAYVHLANGTTTLTNSSIQESGGLVAIGIAPATYTFRVQGTMFCSNSISGSTISGSSILGNNFLTSSSSGNALSIYPQDKDAPYIRFGAGNDNTTFTTEWARFLTSGYLGIGTVTPTTRLQVAETASTSPRGIMSSQHNDGTDGARFHMRKSRGTNASPTIITTGDILGKLVSSGYDGSNYLEMGAIEIASTGTIATTRVPTQIKLYTATDATPSVLTLATTIDASQNLTQVGKVGGSNIETNATTKTTRVGILSGYSENESAQRVNVFIGHSSGYSISTGMYNNYIGGSAGYSNITGSSNNLFGSGAGYYTTGSYNIMIGESVGYYNKNGDNNIMIGSGSGFNKKYGSNNIYIGHYSRYYGVNNSNELVIDNQVRGVSANDSALVKTSALVYGVFNATVANQTLAINAKTTVSNDLTYELRHAFIDKSVDYTPSVTQNVYTKITPTFTNVESSNITIAGDSLTIVTAGDYFIIYSVTLNGSNGDDFTIQLRKNNASVKILRQTTTGATNYHSVTLIWYFNALVAGDDISLWITNIASNNDPTLSSQDVYIRKEHD